MVLSIHSNIVPPLVVMVTGGGGNLLVGDNHTLTCTVSVGASISFTYQWQKYGEVLSNQNPPDMYSFSPLREADVGRYNCQVSVDSSISNTSEDVVINVESKFYGKLCIIFIRCIVELSIKIKLKILANNFTHS